MNTDFDFNINNYTIPDIENFLGLNQDYTFNDVMKRKQNMVTIIIDNKQYDKPYRKKLVDFMEESVVKVIDNIKKTVQFGMNKNTVELDDIIGGKKQRVNPIETFQTNISRSNLNVVKRKTFNQTVMMNTLFREDYTSTISTDFNIVLPAYFKNVMSLRLSSLQLPNVMYNISAANGNNTMYIEVDNGGPSGGVTMPDGNYDINSFITVLQTQINTQLSTTNFSVTYDQYTQKITITYTDPPLNPNFTMVFYVPTPKYDKYKNLHKEDNDYRKNECVDISQIYKGFGWFMGYRKAEYSGATSYTTEAVYSSSPYEYIYFTLNDYNMSQSQNIFGMFSKSILGDNILAIIPVTSNSFNICFDNGVNLLEKKREYYGPVNIQRLKIQLLNQYGEILNLNHMDFSFSLEFEIGYDW